MLGIDAKKKEVKTLDKIVDTLQKLDEQVSHLEGDNAVRDRNRAEKKAMDEINRFMRENKELVSRQSEADYYDDYGTEADYARQNQAMNDIEAACHSLSESMKNIAPGELESDNYEKLEQTLADIKQILHSVGRYDNYMEEELEREVPSR